MNYNLIKRNQIILALSILAAKINSAFFLMIWLPLTLVLSFFNKDIVSDGLFTILQSFPQFLFKRFPFISLHVIHISSIILSGRKKVGQIANNRNWTKQVVLSVLHWSLKNNFNVNLPLFKRCRTIFLATELYKLLLEVK